VTIPPAEERIFPSKPIEAGPTAGQPSGAAFQSYMEGAGKQQRGAGQLPGAGAMPGTAQTTAPTTPGTTTPSMQTLSAQVATSQDRLVNVQNQLNKVKRAQEQNPDVGLTRSQTHLIRNKLTDATDHLRAANAKMGAPVPDAPTPPGSGPIGRFLGYILDGENQLKSAREQLSTMAKNGDQLNPADMMLVQIRLNQAEQEISYASLLLSKVVSNLSQLLSTQL
jgi:hypothetical protein